MRCSEARRSRRRGRSGPKSSLRGPSRGALSPDGVLSPTLTAWPESRGPHVLSELGDGTALSLAPQRSAVPKPIRESLKAAVCSVPHACLGKSPEVQAFPELSREAGSPRQGTSGGNRSHCGPSPGSQTVGVQLEHVNTCTRTRGHFNMD